MKIIRTLLKEIRHIKGVFVAGVTIFLLSMLTGQLAPLLLQGVIDGSISGLRQGQDFDQASLLLQLSYYLGLVTVGAVFSYFSTYLLIHGANRITENLRNRAYDVLQGLPISYFDDKPAGKIATRIVNDTETLRNQFFSILVYIFSNIIRIAFTYGIIFYMNATVGMALLILLPAFYFLQVLYKKLTDKPREEYFDARSEVNTHVNETMNGASILQLYGQEDAMIEEFDRVASKMKQADDRIIWAQSISSWTLTELVRNGAVALILTIVGYQFLSGHLAITPGLLFVYLNYVVELFDLLGALVRQFPSVQNSIETGKRVLELLEEDIESDCERPLTVTQGRVVFDHVSFAYEEGKPILRDISIEADKGQTVALVGHTGSGKTSIMNLLYRFYDPQQGRVLIDGQDITQVSRESLRSHMGIVLQDPYLFTGTVASNVSMDQADAKPADIIAALEKVGAHDLLARLDKGIEEPVLEKGSSFSSGERQLISFARTLFSNPEILILDEATSHIDTETEEIIQRAMEVVKEGRTTFIIAHRLSTIQNADQILVLDAGRIVERGNHEELLAKNGIYAQMHRIQQKV